MRSRGLVCGVVLLWLLSGCTPPDRSEEISEEPPATADPTEKASAEEKPPRIALWVLAEGTERTLEAPDRIDSLIATAQRLGVTDLFVQVYRAGRSWYPSAAADDAPYRRILAAGHAPPLPALLARAHERDIRVHAWFNALSLATNRNAPLLARVGRDAVLVDRAGRSLLDYPDLELPIPDRLHMRMGTPGIWLDPATPGVIEELERALDDLVAAAPELDGLHLDFIRHPMALPIVPGSRFDVGLDFGYGAAAKAGFERASGRAFHRGEDWDRYRRERVDDVVRRLGARVPNTWERSAAVLPWADRAYLSASQDWRRWLEEDWLDFAVAMAYVRDDRLLRYLAGGLTGGVEGDRVWLGLGTWLFANEPERIRSQLEVAGTGNPAGIAVFSYDAIAHLPEAQAAVASLREPPLDGALEPVGALPAPPRPALDGS